VGAGWAFGRRRQDRDGRSRGIGGDETRGPEGRGGGLRGTRSVEAGEIDQRVCGLCRVEMIHNGRTSGA